MNLVRLDSIEKLYDHGAGVLFRRSSLEAIGGYDDTLRNAEDYDLLYRLMKNGSKGFYLPVPMYRYYIHGDNMTLSGERELFKNIVREKHEI